MVQEFAVDGLYSNEEISTSLNISNAAGVRVSVVEDAVMRAAIMTAPPTIRRVGVENPYHDRIESNILTYTAAGKTGDQTLSGINKRIPEQLASNYPIYGFEIVADRRNKAHGPKRWKFLGLLEFVRNYPDKQIDIDGQLRNVWVFEFRIHKEPHVIPVSFDAQISSDLLTQSRKTNSYSEDDTAIVMSDDSQDKHFAQVEAVRSKLLNLEPRGFELIIRDLMIHSGFENVHVTQYSQDGGIDVNATAGLRMWPVQNMLIQVQAKRWLHTVGRKEVAELRGSLQPYARGAVISTGHFSKAAMKESVEIGKNPIVLIDGFQLSKIVLFLNYGEKLPS